MQKKEVEKIYKNKIEKLKKYDKAYFDNDSPVVSDKIYDEIRQEIINLEKKYKYLKDKFSPTQKVGFEPSSKFKKVAHAKNPVIYGAPEKSRTPNLQIRSPCPVHQIVLHIRNYGKNHSLS